MVALIQAIVRDEMSRWHIGDLGVVTSVFPHGAADDRENYECNVLLKNAGLELRRVPVATPTIGVAAIPNVDDLVLVTFVAGDVQQPVILGRLYNDQQRPPLNTSNEIAFHLPLDADDDEALKLAIRSGGDHDPKRQVEVQMGTKLVARLGDGDPLVSLEGENVTVTVGASGDLTVESKGKLAITASGGLDLKSDGSMNIEAGGAMTIKGATIDLN
ncbi:MAG TPA: phage baseplate assembly protein V [Chloroflexota bacterium]|jgi:phage baseplate assembly protein gpV